jgi:hypothetical protein
MPDLRLGSDPGRQIAPGHGFSADHKLVTALNEMAPELA